MLTVLFAAALVNNFVLVQFLGLCPFMGTSARLESAVPMGLATTFVLTLSTLLTHTIYNRILEPLDLTYLRVVVFIVVIASVVQLTEIYVRHTSPLLHKLLGIYLPLITSNCAVLGVALMAFDLPFTQAIAMGVGSALGFSLVLVLFANLRQQLDHDAIPRMFRGPPIALVTVGIMAMAFSGLRGLV